LHASKVFTTPIATFEDTPYQQNFLTPIGLQIELNQTCGGRRSK